MAVSRTDPSGLDTGALGFRLAPRINAAGRLRRADAGLELLLTEDPAPRQGDRRRARRGQPRAARGRAADHVGGRGAGGGAGRALRVRARGRGLASGGDRDRRLADRRAPPPAGHPGLARGRARDRLGTEHPRLRPARRAPRRREPSRALRRAPRGGGPDAPAQRARGLPRGGGASRRERAHAGAARAGGEGGRARLRGTARARARRGAGRARALRDRQPPRDAARAGRPVRGRAGDGGRAPREVLGQLRRASERARWRSDARAGWASIRASRRTRASAWSATCGTARSRPGWCCATRGAVQPPPIEVLGEPEDFLGAALAELDAALPELEAEPGSPAPARPAREVLDRRGESPLAVLHDALSAGGGVLAVCADVPRRLGGISSRIGGFALISYHSLHGWPDATQRVRPRGRARSAGASRASAPCSRPAPASPIGHGDEAELRFAEQMHELEYGLRASLAPLYRALRGRSRVTGEELEHLLRGDTRAEPPGASGGPAGQGPRGARARQPRPGPAGHGPRRHGAHSAGALAGVPGLR